MGKYYEISLLTNCDKKYGSFLNHYEPYQEIREFRKIYQPFYGFSNKPIIFERDDSYKNDEPISDFLLANWGEIIVSQRIYDMLKEKYSSEMDFYECYAKDGDELKPYYILRRKYVLDVLDKSFYSHIDPVFGVMRNILIDDIPENHNFFDVKHGTINVISRKLYKDLKALNPTNFETTSIATTSEELAARERIAKKKEKQNKN